MAIFLNEHSKVIVQGLTGAEGTKHATKMLAAGTNIVGGVNARKAGSSVSIGGRDLSVFGSVEEAMKETGADVSASSSCRRRSPRAPWWRRSTPRSGWPW